MRIKYNGTTIASFPPGLRATVKCEDKKMATDLRVEADALEIGEATHNGMTTKIGLGGSAVFRCGFKQAPTEIVVVAEALTPGLYDENDNLVASWDTLVNTYGMDIEKDYPVATFSSDPATPFNVLKNNSELSAGTKLVIGDGVTKLGEMAFALCKNLTNIALPHGVTSIGLRAFQRCDSLTSLAIPRSVTRIGDLAFLQAGLTSIIIPDSVISIGLDAFNGCRKLESVTLPDNGMHLSTFVFSNCASLASLVIPDSVTGITNEAGYSRLCENCTSLVRAVIGKGIENIGFYAFSGCTSLTNIVISDGVTVIGHDAFAGCTSLTDVYYRGTEAQWNAISIADGGNAPLLNATIHYNYTD